MRFFLLILFLLIPRAAFGQTDEPVPEEAEETGGLAAGEIVLWDITGDGDLEAFRKGVSEALAEDAARHLLTDEAFQKWLGERSVEVPGCFRGLAECVSPGAILFDALELSGRLRVTLGPDNASWAIVDGRGQALREGVVTEKDPRKRAFAVVREIFDATGVVTIGSEPPGATVEIDGRSVGTTPFTYRVDVGEHTYRLRLQDYETAEGSLVVSSGRATTIKETLDQLAGTLLVVDAPENAEVYVNGQLAGRAGKPLTLEPGSYTLEVRAEGYEPLSDAVTVEPGLAVKRSAPLQQSNPFLKDISSEAIIFNNYILRFGFEYGIHDASFQDARSNDEDPVEFIGLADESGNLAGGLQERLGTTGLRLDASYGLKNFALVLVSLSYLSRSTDVDGFVSLPGVGNVPVTITSVRRLQLRPFQVFYRYFYRNFVPFLESGIGINFQWLEAQGADFSGGKTLRRTDALWTVAVGGQYYFTENLFGLLRYSFQDYFERGLGSDHQISIGVGAAFPNLFGFDAEPPEQL